MHVLSKLVGAVVSIVACARVLPVVLGELKLDSPQAQAILIAVLQVAEAVNQGTFTAGQNACAAYYTIVARTKLVADLVMRNLHYVPDAIEYLAQGVMNFVQLCQQTVGHILGGSLEGVHLTNGLLMMTFMIFSLDLMYHIIFSSH